MIGRTIGPYRIEGQLGAGGMGIVYRAHDSRLDRQVALKFLPPHLSADENAKDRFKQEARAASALDHTNICTIHDIGEDEDGKLFIVMAFYEGQTLKYRLEEESISTNDAVRIAHQVASGVARAHEAGIVHRDLKPANIMVTDRGEVKILDFGVAKLSQSIDLTQSGATVGTAAYMSPEQARGESVDFRADIWSIGILMFEMLSGKRPFEGGYEAALIYAIINEDPPALPEGIPDSVEDIVWKCLAKQPEDRYSTTEELAADLEAHLSPSGARAALGTSGAVPTVETPSGAHVHNPLKIAAVYTVVAAVTLGIVYAVMIEFGLPDWVFPIGVGLMIVGFPILLYSARAEDLGAGPSWLTFRGATWGGVVAMSGLALLSASYMTMRVLGIGPAATLVSSGALDENAKLIVAEFENRTTDSTLAPSVTEALRIDLSQSPTVQMMDGSSIVDVLSRMGRPQNTRIDLNTAMEIAAREGAEAVITGEISPVGRGFVLSARLLAARDGSELAAIRENAADDGAIIQAIDRLSAGLRERIGESLKTIRANPDLDRVTTNSLDALRLYSQGVSAVDRGEFERSIDLLRQAIAQDSTFAMAYRKLAVVYSNNNAPFNLEIDAISRAYELRQRLPEHERWLAMAYYYNRAEGDYEAERSAYRNLLEKYPDDVTGLNNLALSLNRRGDYELAEPYLEHVLTIGDRYTFYDNMIDALSGQKEWDELAALLNRFEETHPDHPARYYARFLEAFSKGDYQAADTLIKSSTLSDSPAWRWLDTSMRNRLDALRGKLRSAETGLRRSAEINVQRGATPEALQDMIRIAYNYLDLKGDRVGAERVLREGLSRYSLDSLAATARPYGRIAALMARLGLVNEAKEIMAEYRRQVPEGIQKADIDRRLATADILEAEGRLDEAVHEIERVTSIDDCGPCFGFEKARLYARMDSTNQAIEGFNNYLGASLAALVWFNQEKRSIANLELGELYSRRGDLDEAIQAYSRFIELWKNADPDLQPRVQYARDRVDALLDMKTREPG